MYMKKTTILLLTFCINFFWTQVLVQQHPVQYPPRLQFDYWIYSTNAGNGSTSQYPINAGSISDMDKMFDTSFSNTTLIQAGRTSDIRIIDWTATSTLTSMGINVPNGGNYFALKVNGTFIPERSGTYTFTLESDDASDITFNGSMVFSRYQGLAIANLGTNTFTVANLVAGRSYPFVIRMQNGSGGTGLRFYWRNSASGYASNWSQAGGESVTSPELDGSSFEKAAPSAQHIKNVTGTNTDGVYWINLPMVGPTQIFCIMNSAVHGGGWMMAMKATRGNTFNYDSSYWTTFNTLNPTATNRNDGDAKFESMNNFSSKDLLAIFPDITTSGTPSISGYGWTWLQNNFNNGSRIRLVNFFSSVSRLFIQDADLFSGTAPFTTQTDVRFYGFNYSNASLSTSGLVSRSRWGFGWNENLGGLFPNGNETSPDVAGGIGLSYVNVNNTSALNIQYSAGDYFGCCARNNVIGLNRSARVEIYVR